MNLESNIDNHSFKHQSRRPQQPTAELQPILRKTAAPPQPPPQPPPQQSATNQPVWIKKDSSVYSFDSLASTTDSDYTELADGFDSAKSPLSSLSDCSSLEVLSINADYPINEGAKNVRFLLIDTAKTTTPRQQQAQQQQDSSSPDDFSFSSSSASFQERLETEAGSNSSSNSRLTPSQTSVKMKSKKQNASILLQQQLQQQQQSAPMAAAPVSVVDTKSSKKSKSKKRVDFLDSKLSSFKSNLLHGGNKTQQPTVVAALPPPPQILQQKQPPQQLQQSLPSSSQSSPKSTSSSSNGLVGKSGSHHHAAEDSSFADASNLSSSSTELIANVTAPTALPTSRANSHVGKQSAMAVAATACKPTVTLSSLSSTSSGVGSSNMSSASSTTSEAPYTSECSGAAQQATLLYATPASVLKKVSTAGSTTAAASILSKTVKQQQQQSNQQPTPHLLSKVAPKAIISDDGDIEIQTSAATAATSQPAASVPLNQLRYQQYQQQQHHQSQQQQQQQQHTARILQRNNINRMSMIKIMEDNSNSAKQEALRVNSERVVPTMGSKQHVGYNGYAVNKAGYQYQPPLQQQQPYPTKPQQGIYAAASAVNYPSGSQFSYNGHSGATPATAQQHNIYQSQLAAAAAAAAAVSSDFFVHFV